MRSLLSSLRENDVHISLSDGELSVKFPKGNISEQLLQSIRDNKKVLIDHLQKIGADSYEDIPVVERREYYSISSAQKRLWVLSQFQENDTSNNIAGSYVFEFELDESALQTSVVALVDRHEILRTVFVSVDGEVFQRVRDDATKAFIFKCIDLHSNDEAELAAIVEKEMHAPFDLAEGPLMRITLLKMNGKMVLTYVMHHIISDGWSMHIMMQELLTLYQSSVTGMPHLLKPLRIQYKDYSSWQLQSLNSGKLQRSKEYWLNQLSGELPALKFVDRKMQRVRKGVVGATISRILDATIKDQLNGLTQQVGASLFMGLVAAIKALFCRYTGQTDIILGTPIAGRDHADLESQVGFYVNTLALRTRFNTESTFLELLQHVRDTTLAAYEHQAYPFDELVDSMRKETGAVDLTIFDVLVTLQNTEINSQRTCSAEGSVKLKEYKGGGVTSIFDLLFNFSEQDGRIVFDIIYKPDIYSIQMVERMSEHLEFLLKDVLSHPDRSLDSVAYLSSQDRHQILCDFNNTQSPYPSTKSIVDLFSEQAKLNPQKPAVVFGQKVMTYSDLDHESSKLALCLREKYKIESGSIIGLFMEKNEWIMVSILGILKAGCAYAPLNIKAPLERNKEIVKNAGFRLLVSQLDYFFELSGMDIEILSVDVQLAEYDHGELPGSYHVRATDLAYVLHTSGTTGAPKGVKISHQSVVRLVRNTNYLNFTGDEVLLSTGAVSFDATTFEYWGMLLNGGILVFCPEDVMLNPVKLRKEFENHYVNTALFTTGLFNNLVDIDIHLFEGLKLILVGGDRLSSAHIKKVRSRYPLTRLINVYGPTENGVFSTTHEIYEKVEEDIPIGKPIANSTVYILDQNKELLPVGIMGEICVGGDGLSSGYLRDEELTSQKFIDNPFEKGKKLYKTGDFGKWREDGVVLYMGRNDSQVKIRGFRIELNEIERALKNIQVVNETVVLAYGESAETKNLVAYFTSSHELTPNELRTFLSASLPSYMIPSYFLRLSAFPLTQHGKIDRKMLPEPEGLEFDTGTEYLAPPCEIGKQLATIWGEVLSVEVASVGLAHDFFDLGGHSLKVTRLSTQINKWFDVQLGLKELFNHSKLAQQIELIKSSKKIHQIAIPQAPSLNSYPMSSAQQRLWILSLFEGGNAAYNVNGAYTFRGILKVDVLEQSLCALIDRHESLRTVFRRDNDLGEVRQFIRPSHELDIKMGYRDLAMSSNQPGLIDCAISQEMSVTFDLSEGPLFNVCVIRVAKDEFIFCYALHHIISDGWSMEVLVMELSMLYNALSQGLPSPLQPLTIQYKDIAYWQMSQTDLTDVLRAYWLDQLKGELPLLHMPVSKPRPSVKTYSGDVMTFRIGNDVTTPFRKLLKKRNATLYMGLVTLVKILLFRYTGQEDLVVGCPISGRDRAELDNQIGLFLNTLPLRTKLKGSDNFETLLQRVHGMIMGAFEHKAYPFDVLVNELNISRDPSRNPLFDVLVILQNNDIGNKTKQAGMDGIAVSSLQKVYEVLSKFDLEFNFTEAGQEWVLSIAFNNDLYDRDTILAMFGHFAQLINSIVSAPTSVIHSLEMLSRDERHKLIFDFNACEQHVDSLTGVVELFDLQADKTPMAIALEDHYGTMSFAMLKKQAQYFAHYLKCEFGLTSEDRVCIMLNRSSKLIVAILGTLKCGAAYVPIDPAYPRERIDFMISDSACRVVIDDEKWRRFTEYTASDDEMSAGNYPKPESLAYVIYTSGSTGTPKGVMIEHRNVSAFLEWAKLEFANSEIDTVLAVTSVCFDLSIFEMFYPLATGKKMLILNDAFGVEGCIDSRENLLLNTVPSAVAALLDRGVALSKLRVLNMAGEPIANHIVERLNCQHVEVRNLYGPTETTTYSTSYRITNRGKVSIGKPIRHDLVYITDEYLSPVPCGVVGEIWIGGAGTARGYLNRPDLTASRFRDNPFTNDGKIYRTGDLGKWMLDGNIELLGRIDDQVKIRGYRIEPDEIREAIMASAMVHQATVLPLKQKNGHSILVAFLRLMDGYNVEALKTELAVKLPTYMMPDRFVEVSEIPLTPNGKTDKLALRRVAETTTVREGRIAPRNKVEEKLVDLWSNVLMIEQQSISVSDNFFQLGGNSIKALQASRFDGSNLPLSLIYENSCIAHYARAIEQRRQQSEQFLRKKYYSVSNAVSVVLVCSMGSAETMYYPLAKELSAAFNVYIVSMPWNNVLFEGRMLNAQEVKSRVLKEMDEQLSDDVILLGHSSGTSLALTLAQRGEPKHYRVVGVIQCARLLDDREQLPILRAALEAISDQQLWKEIAGVLGHTSVLDHEDRKRLIDGVRHDGVVSYQLLQELFKDLDGGMGVLPIHQMYGDNDPLTIVNTSQSGSWKAFASTLTEDVLNNAGHYFVKRNAVETAKLILNIINKWR